MKVKAGFGWLLVGIGIAVVLGGALVAGLKIGSQRLATTPTVGVVALSGYIWSFDATQTVDMLRYAEEQDEIAGIVLEVDSWGGDVTSVEEIYLALLHFREKKPLVASVNMALSGGYYASAPASFIYAKPSSFVGSIGVSWFLPSPEKVEEDVATTGPMKATGFSTKEAMDTLEVLKESFVEAVTVQRKEKLQMTRQELSEAKVYNGGQALRNGLVDAIGSRPDAVKKVAELAGLDKFKVVDMNRVFFLKELEDISRSTRRGAEGSLTEVLKFWREIKAAGKPQQPLPRYQYPY